MSKASLAVFLSKLPTFTTPNPTLEQYPTDGEIAADILWKAHLLGDVEGKKIADLGAGTGILGIGALYLGSEQVDFVERDEQAIKQLKKNVAGVEGTHHIIHDDVESYEEEVDVIIMNPPFGVQQKHADKPFLDTAFRCAPVVYVLGKEESNDFFTKYAAAHGFQISHHWSFSFPLKRSMPFHSKQHKHIRVGCWRMEKA